MRLRLHVLPLLFLTWCAAQTADLTAQPQPPAGGHQRMSAALRARLEKGERLRVVVSLRVPGGPTDGAPGNAAAALAEVQDRVLARTPHLGVAKRLAHLPIVAMEVDAGALPELLNSPDVTHVQLDELRRPTLSESVPLIGAPTAWAAGATGGGWTVAVLDSGVDKAHPFLAGKVVSEACYSTVDPGFATSVCPGGLNTTAPGSGVPCDASVAGCDHGTHVAGIAAGKGPTFSGVAKEASIIAIQVYSRIDDVAFCNPDPSPCTGAYDSDILAGLDRVYALRNQFNIASALLSLGDGAYPGACDASVPAYKAAIDLLRTVGIPTVVSSGNEGLTDMMSSPACVSTAISVGASDKNDLLAAFTNRNPLLKLLAPGSLIYSPAPGGSFSLFNGTSMAAAHVAGAWALVKDLNPTADVPTVLNAFTATAVPVTDAANNKTWPRINVGAAVSGAQQFDRMLGPLWDFDGLDTGDIFWRKDASDTYAIWLMNGSTPIDISVFGIGSGWKIVGTGDVNGDGKSDILWRSATTGALSIWFMNGTTVLSTTVLGVGAGWELASVGDMNGDGKADVVWFNATTTSVAIWFMNGGTVLSTAVLSAAAGWDLVGTGDLNGDNRNDLIWRAASNGSVAIWFMNGGTVQSSTVLGVGPGWDLLGSLDLNNDGRDDFVWRAQTSGTLAFWLMNGGTVQSTAVFGVGTDWQIVGLGDMNANGTGDILWRQPSTNYVAIWFLNGSTVANTAVFGVGAGWVPVVPE